MTTRDFAANVISASKVVPDGNFKTSKASGVWDINEALDLIKGGNWPNAANLDPATFVDGLFSTFVYQGDGQSNRDIVNNINLSDNGGLVWLKTRGTSYNHFFNNPGEFTGYAQIPSTSAWTTSGNFVTFNNDGFRIPVAYSGANATNSTQSMVAWTFRKQPKFFDIVTYTGDGSTTKTVSHNLGSTPGMIIFKRTDSTGNWIVYHANTPAGGYTQAYMRLNAAFPPSSLGDYGNSLAPTSSVIRTPVHSNASNTADSVNVDGASYVAYIFANNNDDGGFGEPEDQDIIKCGSFSTDGSGNATVNLGFEPQWLMVKATNQSYNWEIYDNIRGFGVNGHNILIPNLSNAEGSNTTAGNTQPTNTGFSIGGGYWGNNVDLIYMAIRRGGMQTPSTPSDVFHIQSQSNADSYSVGFPTDLVLLNKTGGSSANSYVGSRLLGNSEYLVTNTNSAEASSSNLWTFDGANTKNDFDQGASTSSAWVGWHWARARGYFDVATYTGTGSVRTVTHNLGAVPEMIWVKRRDSGGSWGVWHKDLTSGYYLGLDTDDPQLSNSNVWTTTDPTATQFSVGTQGFTNSSGGTFIAYLFATVAGVSKVGSFTATGSDVNVDCGFTNGAKFVLIKRTNSADDWFIFRDIVAGNDKRIKLNTTGSEATGSDNIDPLSSGFTMTSGILGDSGNEFIFYAIANDPS